MLDTLMGLKNQGVLIEMNDKLNIVMISLSVVSFYVVLLMKIWEW